MKTIVLKNPGDFYMTETQAPGPPAENEALVRIRRIGICGTDLHAYRGRQPFFTYPRILGHELGIEVLQVGSNEQDLQPGDHCALEPGLYCGACIACRRGRTNCCRHLKLLGVHVDGGMRELIKVPITHLHRSEKLDLEQLALVETLSIGCHAIDRARAEPNEPTLVIGLGPIGLTVVQFAKLAGADVVVMDTNERRLDFCRKVLGIKKTLVAGQPRLLDALQTACGGDLPTLVLDATGNPKCMTDAFDLVACGGRLVLVGLVQERIAFDDPEFHRREITLLASRNSRPRDFDRIIELLEQEKINTTPWITHRASFADMIDQFETWLDPESGTIKPIVEI